MRDFSEYMRLLRSQKNSTILKKVGEVLVASRARMDFGRIKGDYFWEGCW
jgi:hypothetical protein